ncbi:MAG: DNA gyrase inhibitor YacG [Acidobacteria bacterium]|nr:DNA gyrase inhibitor YacG [Acidobacteriota bacterium]
MNRMSEARACVQCRRHPENPAWRPFCSERCRNADLARWADGRYRVAGDAAGDLDDEADTDA